MSQTLIDWREFQRPFLTRLQQLPAVDPAHGLDHVQRVANWTLNLLQQEFKNTGRILQESDEKIAVLSGLLHDCYPVAKNSPDRNKSAEWSAGRAVDWMRECNVPETIVQEVKIAIEDHSYSSGRKARTVYGECLQDADRLEALGALGLYRTIAVGVTMGAELFDPIDPWGKKRERNDRKYTIDHFFTKLLLLADGFNTAAGRVEANQRTKFLKEFLDQLRWEI